MKSFLLDISREAGKMSLQYRARLAELAVERKTERDVVTEADREIESYLVSEIRRRYPDHGILGEESGSHAGDEYRWVIDPIDGTASFVHGQPNYSVSIAVEKAGETVLGAVNAPALDELYHAELGHGAWLNGSRLSVSSREPLRDCILATGFACIRANLPRHNLPYFAAMAHAARDLRRYGSAAVDLAYVACGRLDGFWELNLQPYDVAAGFLLVAEAGGRISDFGGGRAGLGDEVVATNGRIHDEVLAVLAGVDSAVSAGSASRGDSR